MQLFRHHFRQDEPIGLKKLLKFRRFFIMHQMTFRGRIEKNMLNFGQHIVKYEYAADHRKSFKRCNVYDLP